LNLLSVKHGHRWIFDNGLILLQPMDYAILNYTKKTMWLLKLLRKYYYFAIYIYIYIAIYIYTHIFRLFLGWLLFTIFFQITLGFDAKFVLAIVLRSGFLKPLCIFIYYLTLKILSDQIWVAGYFGQPLTYPDFTIFSSDFLCNFLKL
jgi:hypothetical protein